MNIFAYGDGGVSENVRLLYPLSQMIDLDYTLHAGTIKEGSRIPTDKDAVYIFSRPMGSLNAAIIQLKNLGATVIVDVDDNFWAIPKTHIGYKVVGPESLNLKALENILPLADAVVSSTEPLGQTMLSKGLIESYFVVPNACNSHNQYNRSKPRGNSKVKFGYTGTITHRDDFKMIIKPLLQFLKNEPNAAVVICGDPEIYRTLRGIPEDQKYYLPMYPYRFYPAQLAFFDVMIVPLVNDTFNRSKSDIKILDALVNAKPFIASAVEPYLPYENSGAGFVVANEERFWLDAFDKMMDPVIRAGLSRNSYELSKEHSVAQSADLWKHIITTTMEKKNA
jgi:glycosyltransferase involved in cell wall biosynthesis